MELSQVVSAVIQCWTGHRSKHTHTQSIQLNSTVHVFGLEVRVAGENTQMLEEGANSTQKTSTCSKIPVILVSD